MRQQAKKAVRQLKSAPEPPAVKIIPEQTPIKWKPVQVQLLKEGELVKADLTDTVFEVKYVNPGRAHCCPIDKPVGHDSCIDIAPSAFVERVTAKEAERLAEARRHGNRASGKQDSWLKNAPWVPGSDAQQPISNESEEEESDMGVSALPGSSGKSNREINKEQRRKIEARKAANRQAGIGVKGGTGRMAAAKSKVAKPPKTVRKCACGCGEETTSYFAPGHDARWHGWARKLASGALTPEDLSAQQRKSLGELKKSGKGYSPVLDYKGEKYVATH